MASDGPSKEKIAFEEPAHGKPVTLKDELPGYPTVGSAVPASETPVAHHERTFTKVEKHAVGDGDGGDSELKQKLLVAGALVAAGVAIVFGVRHFRGEEQPEETTNWLGRKVKETKHDAKHAAKETKKRAEEAGDKAHEKGGGLLDGASDAFGKAGNKAQDAFDTATDKVDELRHDAKDKIEAETKKADKRANSPGLLVGDSPAADLEQRRMTYGQDKHGVPKGLTEDAGFLGYKNWLPGAKKR